MWYRIAWGLHSTLEEAQRRVGADEYRDYCELYEQEPWGPGIDDQRWSQLLLYVFANVAPRGSKPKLEDFTATHPHEDETQQERLIEKLGAWAQRVRATHGSG